MSICTILRTAMYGSYCSFSVKGRSYIASPTHSALGWLIDSGNLHYQVTYAQSLLRCFIAATIRGLNAALSSCFSLAICIIGSRFFRFRVPPLREPREDESLLAEYFIDRYARNADKSIRHINQETLELPS